MANNTSGAESLFDMLQVSLNSWLNVKQLQQVTTRGVGHTFLANLDVFLDEAAGENEQSDVEMEVIGRTV
jgi:hypothetical protein